MKRALICGVSGQDGAYLSHLLLGKGYEVYGGSRDAQMGNFGNLKSLGVFDQVKLVSLTLTDFRSVLQAIVRIEPDEIYNLAGQSSVGLSFQQPVETLESVTIGTMNLLECLRFTGLPSRLYNAASGECFGDTAGLAADESTPFRPRSPYAVAKAAAFWELANYREAYGLQAGSGILFNHESALRPQRFVTRKVVAAACRIAGGSDETLTLGDLSVKRDWGWAPEYVEAMWRMLQAETVDDFVIATGESHSLEDFVRLAFSSVNLDWHEHVAFDPELIRPSEIRSGAGNPAKAARVLGWAPRFKMHDVVKMMVRDERTLAAGARLAPDGGWAGV